MKKHHIWLNPIIAALIFIGSITGSEFVQASFGDLSPSHPNYTAIVELRNRSVISGYPDGSFRPDKVVNRVEALKMIVLANSRLKLKVEGLSGGKSRFPDILAGAWYVPYLNVAHDNGIVSGYPDGSFRPDKVVNLVESLKMIFKAWEVDLSNVTVFENPYADAFKNQWYTKYVEYAKAKNLIDSDASNKVYLDRGMTRGMLAELLYRFIYINEKRAATFPAELLKSSGYSGAATGLGSSTLQTGSASPDVSGGVTTGAAPLFIAPKPGDTFQWQITEKPVDLSANANVFDIDLFDNSKEDIQKLHSMGKKVICYLSAGSYENWRPDKNDFPVSIIGKDYTGWTGEKWLDIRQIDLLGPIMQKRFALAKEKGCDGIEPDNIDGYGAATGFPLTGADQLKYNIWLANEVHKLGLSIALKNDPEQAVALLPYYDWALTEDCDPQGWCEQVAIFAKNGKAVMQVEYTDKKIDFGNVCKKAKTLGFTAILKNRKLDAWRNTCEPITGASSSIGATIPATDTTSKTTSTTGSAVPPLKTLAEKRGVRFGALYNYDRRGPKHDQIFEAEMNAMTIYSGFSSVPGDKNDGLSVYDLESYDAQVAWGRARNMELYGQTLVWFEEIPNWLKLTPNADVEGIMNRHIDTLVGRYKGQIKFWNVVNEAVNFNGTLRRNNKFTEAMGDDYIRKAFMRAHTTDPGAILYYNDFDIEIPENTAKFDGAKNLLINLKKQGVPVHALGWQMHVVPKDFDAATLLARMNEIADLGFDNYITELDVAIPENATAANYEQQKQIYKSVIETFLKARRHKDIITWGIHDNDPGWLTKYHPFLWDEYFNKKPAYFGVQEALK